MEIRLILDGFNTCRASGISPGCHITVDESMSAWKGADATFVAEGEPHVTKIKRKPEGVGAELKCAADGDSGIMLRLDVMEGQAAQRAKEYYDIYKSEGTAVLMRLVQPWMNCGRVVHADSAFSSVKTLLALRSVGTFFMGIIKTAHTQFPVKFLQAKAQTIEAVDRGSHTLLSSNQVVGGARESVPMYALGWFDAVPKFILSSCGVTSPGTEVFRKRHRKVVVNGMFTT